VYANDFYGYHFSYPPQATIGTRGVSGFPSDELPADMTSAEYRRQLEETYPEDICVTVRYRSGFVAFIPPEDKGGRYAFPCGVTGVGAYEIHPVTDTVTIEGQTYTIPGTQLREQNEAADWRGEFYSLDLGDGWEIDYGSLNGTQEAFLEIKETLLQIVVSLHLPQALSAPVPFYHDGNPATDAISSSNEKVFPPTPTPGPAPTRETYAPRGGESIENREEAVQRALLIDSSWAVRQRPLTDEDLAASSHKVIVEFYPTRQEAEAIYLGGGSPIPESASEPVWVVRIKGAVQVQDIGGLGRGRGVRETDATADGVTYIISQATGDLLAISESAQTRSERLKAIGIDVED
jgi:hypothetical protein